MSGSRIEHSDGRETSDSLDSRDSDIAETEASRADGSADRREGPDPTLFSPEQIALITQLVHTGLDVAPTGRREMPPDSQPATDMPPTPIPLQASGEPGCMDRDIRK